MSIDKVFNKSAKYYDTWVRKGVPCFNELFSISVDLIAFKRNASLKVLDLGAGTGIFSKFILKKYPNAQFTLWDISPKMLQIAKNRFRKHRNQFEFVVDDYKNIVGSMNFDLVVSSLSIHHLGDSQKRRLFKNIYRTLKKGGVFINADQVKGETGYIAKLYWDNWLAKVRQNKASQEEIKKSIQRRKAYDKDSSLLNQIKWLKDAGFKDVDCVYKNYFLGIFFAVKK